MEIHATHLRYRSLQIGGLNDILKALLDNDNKGISNQELSRLLQKIENDATEIYHEKYGSDDKIKFNIDCNNTPNANLIGRQNVKSLECIRKSIRKNLDLMHENMKTIFRLYLIQCGEGNTINDA
jgi:hypothetical protein